MIFFIIIIINIITIIIIVYNHLQSFLKVKVTLTLRKVILCYVLAFNKYFAKLICV